MWELANLANCVIKRFFGASATEVVEKEGEERNLDGRWNVRPGTEKRTRGEWTRGKYVKS